MKIIVKFLLLVLIFVISSFYSFYSFIALVGDIKNYDALYPKYEKLVATNRNLLGQVDALNSRVVGLREKTLNKDLLEERAKIILNYRKKQEIVIN